MELKNWLFRKENHFKSSPLYQTHNKLEGVEWDKNSKHGKEAKK